MEEHGSLRVQPRARELAASGSLALKSPKVPLLVHSLRGLWSELTR